jgi:hypothetical protein
VTGNEAGSLLSAIKYNLYGQTPDFSFSGIEIAVLIVLGLITLTSILFLFSVINSKKIKSRKTFRLLMWALLISAGIFFLVRPVSLEIFWLAGITVSYLMSHYFVFRKARLIPEILFSLLFILVATMQIANWG